MDGTANGVMALPEVLDLAAAKDFLDTMRDRTGGGVPLRLDASAVRTLTVPCMQIMLAARAQPGTVVLVNPTEEFSASFADIGLEWPADETGAPDISAAAQPGAMTTDTPGEDAMSKRVLTIDDSKTMRDMLMLTLAEAGFDVVQAVDGQDGLDVLAKERPFDVVITDINMPRMDGYEVIRRMRKVDDYKATPILVLTTESEIEKRSIAREAGATGWMVKPFDPERLVETVRKVSP
jgi:two-component system chemotaxis response regulator CheY